MLSTIHLKIFKKHIENRLSLAKEVYEVRRKNTSGGPSSKQIAEAIVCLDFFYRTFHTKKQLLKMITDGRGDLHFADAVVVGTSSVDIFDIKSITTNQTEVNIDAVKLGVEKYFRNRPSRTSHVPPSLRNQLNSIHRKSILNLNLYVVRSWNQNKIEEFEKKCGHLLSNYQCQVKVLTPEMLTARKQGIEELRNFELPRDPHPLLEKDKRGNVTSVLALASIDILLKEYRHPEKGQHLFFDNVRSPLEEKKFMASLFNSLTKQPNKFHLFHNGITVTAKNIEDRVNSISVYNPQIVNGAQTLGALYALSNSSSWKRTMGKEKIVVKVVRVENNEMVDDICATSNTQKPVTSATLRSNDSLQKNLELYINAIGDGEFFYARKPLSKSKLKLLRSKHRIIDKEKFMQWANSTLMQKPFESKNQKDKLFVNNADNPPEGGSQERYIEIRTVLEKDWDDIEAICRFGTQIQDEIKKLPFGNGKMGKKNYARIMDEHILASIYQNWVFKQRPEFAQFDFKNAFKEAFEYHLNKFKVAKQKHNRKDFHPRNYFISPESWPI